VSPGQKGVGRLTETPASGKPGVGRDASFRYAGSLVLILILLLFLIAAPDSDWSKAVALAIEGAVVVVVAITSIGKASVSERRALIAGGVTTLVVVLVAAGIVPFGLSLIFGGLLTAAIIAVLLQGLARLIERNGVTAQAVAGAATIYLLIGLVFAWTIGVVARLSSMPYFAQHVKGTTSRIVYFAFTTLSTTGYGDLTPATSFGRALAVLEMVLGQLYLVTVIGVLVGNFVGGRRRAS
jgi:hypothetical protein